MHQQPNRPLLVHPRARCLGWLLLSLVAAAPSHAQSAWTSLGSTDWSDPNNWFLGVPSATLGGRVNSTFPPAIATGIDARALSLEIGVGNNPVGPGNPSAVVVLDNADLTVGGALEVGIAEFLSARGFLSSTGGPNFAGDVRTGALTVGRSGSAPSSGQVNLGGNLTLQSRVEVGSSVGGGTAFGSVSAASVRSSGLLDALIVGLSTDPGTATGTLIDRSGTGSLVLGVDEPALIGVTTDGTATGHLEAGLLDAFDTTLWVGVSARGSADGAVDTAGDVAAGELFVGSLVHGSAGIPAATGRMGVGGDLTVRSRIEIGAAPRDGDASGNVTAASVSSTSPLDALLVGWRDDFGTALGTLVDRSRTGSLVLASGARADIGVAIQGNAIGRLEAGILDAFDTALNVGVSLGSGSADGAVDTAGNVAAGELFVGSMAPGAANGAATGRMTAGGDLTVRSRIEVGSKFHDGDASGTVSAASVSSTSPLSALQVGWSDDPGTAMGTLIDRSRTGALVLGNGARADIGWSIQGDATGRLEAGLLDAFDTTLNVGVSVFRGSANGTVETAGNVAAGELFVGALDPGTLATATAAGRLTVGGDLTVRSGLDVGHVGTGAAGSADGLLEVSGTASANRVSVGVSRGPGAAMGELILRGDLTAATVEVGRALGAGTADGDITLDRGLASVGDLILGAGSSVTFEIGGLLRGDEYAAVDAARITLDPTGAVGRSVFDFQPGPGTHTFDLLAATGGAFNPFASFAVLGLDNRSSWSTARLAQGGREIFRLTVTTVPEPGPGVLLGVAIGLAALRGSRTRRAVAPETPRRRLRERIRIRSGG